jgi:SAM-dependent methyltransferase
MPTDPRAAAARYYDLQSAPFAGKDVPFYISLVPSPSSSVLELGCGTGRVLVPLAAHCGYLHGIDHSEAMLEICRKKLQAQGVPEERALVTLGDIGGFELGRKFDLILAAFRVLQNLEEDAQIDGLFRCIRGHLAEGGSCVLNVFRPFAEEAEMRRIWAGKTGEEVERDQPACRGRLIRSVRIARVHPEKFIFYPTLIDRYYEDGRLMDESTMEIAMRCYTPDGFLRLIESHGFRILRKWGGYDGEEYGVGPELVAQFESGGSRGGGWADLRWKVKHDG